MIEIIDREPIENSPNEELCLLAVNGEPLRNTVCSYYKPHRNYSIRVKDNRDGKLIALQTYFELPQPIEYLFFDYAPDEIETLESTWISRSYDVIRNKENEIKETVYIDDYCDFLYHFRPYLPEWKKEYSFSEYFDLFFEIYPSENYKAELKLWDSDEGKSGGFTVKWRKDVSSHTISEITQEHLKFLKDIHSEVENRLLSANYSNSVVLTFDFPDKVKAPCEQYLIYFSQFLRDLGVKATSDLSHEAGQVLFTVTPDNPELALDKIRAALEVYLQLPTSPIDAYPDVSTEVEVQRLTANIQHLKGQLTLAKAEIRAAESAIELKDTTIQVLRLTVDEQNRLLSGDISSSIKDVTPRPKAKDKEDLIKDIVSLKTYDMKVADLHLPEIWRRLKKFFKDEN